MGDGALLLSIVLGVVLGFVLLLGVWQPILDWLRSGVSESGARLPNGSTGWPVIGETIDFARDPRTFTTSRIKTYGNVFKTSLFGNPVVAGTTSEFAKFILTKGSAFGVGWPPNVTATLGPKSWVFKDGPHHMSVKKVYQKSLLPEGIRQHVGMLEKVTLRIMASWAERGAINSNLVTRDLTLEAGLYVLVGIEDIKCTPEGAVMVENLRQMGKSLLSIPINIPGSSYSKGLKAKKSVSAFLKKMLQQRRSDDADTGSDVMGVVLASLKDPQASAELKAMDDDGLVDGLVNVWFGSYDTTSTTLLWSLKLLIDHPDIFRRIKAEQEEVRKSQIRSGRPATLTWEDLKLMEYSTKFMNEVLRYSSLAHFLFRKALQDTEFEGYRIPKGWLVVASTTSVHHNPEDFPDPFSFNPSRFDAPTKPNTIIPFAGGAHICPGIEFVRVLTLIFLHHVTTTFTYYPTGSEEGNSAIIYEPFYAPKNGYPIYFSRQPTTV